MIDPLDGERVLSDVAKGKKPWLTGRRKVLLAGTALVGLFAFILWRDPGAKKPEPEPPPPPAGIGQDVTYDPPKPVAMPAAVEKPLAAPFAPAARPAPPSAPPPAAEAPLPQPRQVTAVLPPVPHKQRGMVSYDEPDPPAHGIPAAGAGGAQADPGTSVAFKAASIVGAKAGPAINKSLVLMPGIVRCILDTGINSTIPGPLLCHLDQPVISDGNVVLMEKGTQIIGSYSADVRQAQYRMSAVTATAYTPNGVPIPLGGPFADDLGVTGLEADKVDNHVWQRIGGAVMLSFAEGGLGVLQAEVSKAGNSYVSFSSGGTGSIAQQLLQSTINIPPTITKNQGDPISLWIMTPIDFSGAYKLRSAD